jgi:hypothetical protein
MTNEKKYQIAEAVGEVLIGGAIGTYVNKTVDYDECNCLEKAALVGGVAVLGWMAGRTFAKQLAKFWDVKFGTELSEGIEKVL